MAISEARKQPTRLPASLRTAVLVAGTAVAVNLAVWLVGWTANAEFSVTMSGQAITITPIHVLLTTLISLALGALGVLLVRRRGPMGLRTLAVVGGAVGVLSASLPLQTEADGATMAALAMMHVLTGVIWLVTLWRAAAPEPAGSR